MKNEDQQKRKHLADEWFLKGNHDIENRRFEIAIFPRMTRKRTVTF